MDKIWTIKQGLPEEFTLSNFSYRSEGEKLQNIAIDYEGDLTLDETNKIVDLLNDTLEGFTLNVRFEQKTIRVTIQ